MLKRSSRSASQVGLTWVPLCAAGHVLECRAMWPPRPPLRLSLWLLPCNESQSQSAITEILMNSGISIRLQWDFLTLAAKFAFIWRSGILSPLPSPLSFSPHFLSVSLPRFHLLCLCGGEEIWCSQRSTYRWAINLWKMSQLIEETFSESNGDDQSTGCDAVSVRASAKPRLESANLWISWESRSSRVSMTSQVSHIN